MLRLFRPYVSKGAIKLCRKTLESGQLAEGPVVKQFEKEFGEKFKVSNVSALNSGSSALELAYELAGIKEGDEVIVPVLTCTATNIPLIRRKAKLVFADCDTDLNMDLEDIRRKVTDKTKAIVYVHFGGNSRELRTVASFCDQKGIILIEDAAQAIGSDIWGIGDFTAVSTQAIKTLTSGDGGFLICKDKENHEKAKRLRWFGYDREEKQRFGDADLTEAGYKYHMSDVSASIGLGNLRSIDPILSHRRALAEVYRSYGLFAHAWLAGGFTDDYEGLRKEMEDAGYEIGQHHFRNDKYTLFSEFRNHCPNMDALEGKYFFVPYHHEVTLEDAHNIGTIYAKNR